MSKECYNPIKIHLTHSTRLSRFKYRKYSFTDLLTSANIAVVIFILVDFYVLYSRWESIETNSWRTNLIVAFGCAVALDLPFNILGSVASKYKKKLLPKKDFLVIAVISITTFIIIYSCCFAFTYLNSEATYSLKNTGVDVDDYDEAEPVTTDDAVASNADKTQSEKSPLEKKMFQAAAIFMSVVPLATSFTSFIIAYHTNNFIKMDLHKVKRCYLEAQEHRRCLESAVAFGRIAIIDHGTKILLEEDDGLSKLIEDTNDQEHIRQQAFLAALSHIVSADGVNRIIEASYDRDRTAKEIKNTANPKLQNFLVKKYNKE